MKRIVVLLTALGFLAACGLPGVDQMNGKNPMPITTEPSGSLLERTGCLMGIQSTGAGAIATYKAWKEGTERDTGLAPMLTNNGVLIQVDVRNNWRKVAGYAGYTALSAAVTADQCRYTLFAGQSITYWCGTEEHLIHRWDRWEDGTTPSPMQMRPEDYDFFFNSGKYSCWNGWAYPRPTGPEEYCWGSPCIWDYRDQ